MKTAFLLSFLLIAAYAKVTPSPDFNITDFPGTWNLIGLYGLESENMAFYSCATMDVTIQGALNIVTLNESWIETKTNSFVNKKATLIPSPLNNAILISTTSPSPQNNYVVAYYNTTARQAILINQAATVAFVLSGDEKAHGFFILTASSVLTQAGIDFNSVLEIFNSNCDYGKLVPLAGFNASSIVGKTYYANLAFTETGTLDKSDLCPLSSTIEFSVDGDFLSLNYTKGEADKFDNETVLPYPGLPAVFIDTAIDFSIPLTITYQDTENDVILIFREPLGIALSRQTSMKPVIASSIIQALENQGFSVNTANYALIPSSCYQGQAFLA